MISLIIRLKLKIITSACILQCYLASQISLRILLPPLYAPCFLLPKHAKLIRVSVLTPSSALNAFSRPSGLNSKVKVTFPTPHLKLTHT